MDPASAAEKAEAHLIEAERLLGEAQRESPDFKFIPKSAKIAAADAEVGGNLVRVVSIVSEKSPTFTDLEKPRAESAE